MRREMREALERFLRGYREGNEKPQTRDEHIGHRAKLAFNLYLDIRDLGGLEAALADDPTDNAPDLAAIVAAQGVAIEGLRLALEEERRERLALDRDLRAVEAALMDLAHERAAPAEEGWLVEPVEWMNGNCFGRLGNYILGLKWEADQWILTVRQPEGPRRLDIRDGWSIGVRHNGRVEVVA